MPQDTTENQNEIDAEGEELDNFESPLMQFSGELTEDAITKKCKTWNSEWDQYAVSLHDKLRGNYKLYRDMENTIENVSVKIPEVWTVIETELPHLLNSIYSHSAVVDAKPKFQDPSGEKTYKIKSYINKLIKDICKGRKKTEMLIKNTLIYGWGVAKCYWDVSPDHDVDPFTKEVIDVNSAHPDFYNIDPFSFGFKPDYDGQNLDELEWLKERIFISKNRLKEMRDSEECSQFSDSDLTAGDDKGQKMRNKDVKSQDADKTYYDEFWSTL